MYFSQKEDTNIDKVLKKNKRLTIKSKMKSNKKILTIIVIVVVAIIIAIAAILILKNTTRYYLKLNGDANVTIYQGDIYNEAGYNAYDNHKNDLINEVIVSSNLDSNTIGTYIITYSLHNKVKKRTIKVIARP